MLYSVNPVRTVALQPNVYKSVLTRLMEDNNQQIPALTESPKSSAGLVVGLIVLVLVGIGGYFVFGKNKPAAQEESQSEILSTFSMDEVAKHATGDDCWLVIDGGVYNVTSFVPRHPGEEKIHLGCGKDATDLFNSKAGKGISHSSTALKTRESLKIGILAEN